jgi:endonuclease/exonuclease/phosphatase family metal-dependent hydrolase
VTHPRSVTRQARQLSRLVGVAVLSLALAVTMVPRDPAAAQEPATLRVMTFNIWVGGERVDFAKVVEAIELADADIVGIQEAGGNLARLAGELGWYHLEERGRHQQIISRYPLVRGTDPDVYVYALIDAAHAVAVSNVHLSAFPYGPYELRDGATVEEALAMEQRHLDELADHFEVLPRLADADVPAFFVGDLNVPSHLDWTQAAADASEEPFRSEIAWPVSVRLDELGFRDTFREIHPDEVATPGYTWTPGYPPPHTTPDEVHDRIDYVYASGPSTTIDAAVVGEDHPISDIVVEPWPSDHRAVVSEFEVTPKPIAELDPSVAPDADSYDHGQPITVDFVGARRGDRITLGPAARPHTPACVVPTRVGGTWPAAGSVVFDADTPGCRWPLEPGDYEVALRSGGRIVTTAGIRVRDPAEQATLELDADTYVSGDAITATFTNAPGNATDWVGIYRVGDRPGVIASRFWQYVGGGQTPSDPVVDGSVTFSADTPGEGAASWPPEPAAYVAYLFAEDGYEVVAGPVAFEVVPSG